MLGYGYGYNKILPRLGGLDPDALEFIANWEASTSVTMQQTQRLAVIDAYRGLKGQGTPNGTDFLTDAKYRGAVIYISIPIDDSNGSANAFKLDMVSNGNFTGAYNGMASGDFTAEGTRGGTAKFFNFMVSPSLYDLDDVSGWTYVNSYNGSSIGWAMGSNSLGNNNRFVLGHGLSVNILRGQLNNDNNNFLDFSTVPEGLIGVQRVNANLREIIKDSLVVNSDTQVSTNATLNNVYGHMRNNNGSGADPTIDRICFFAFGLKSFSATELVDWYTWIQRLQSNVITGGRQIGTAIPPIS